MITNFSSVNNSIFKNSCLVSDFGKSKIVIVNEMLIVKVSYRKDLDQRKNAICYSLLSTFLHFTYRTGNLFIFLIKISSFILISFSILGTILYLLVLSLTVLIRAASKPTRQFLVIHGILTTPGTSTQSAKSSTLFVMIASSQESPHSPFSLAQVELITD